MCKCIRNYNIIYVFLHPTIQGASQINVNLEDGDQPEIIGTNMS